MCERDLENLKRWKSDEHLDMQRAEDLTAQGVEDMKLLGGRLQSTFPQLLQPISDSSTPGNYMVLVMITVTTRFCYDLIAINELCLV